MSVLEVVNEPGFQRIAAILRVPSWSMSWKSHHRRAIPFRTQWRNIERANAAGNKEEVVAALTEALMTVANVAERLRYNTDDVRWIISTLETSNWQTRISMLLAFASAPDTLFTPAELAAVTDIGESTWRKYAATGHVIGAVKKGKQWLLPKSVLVAQGLLTAEQAQILAGRGGVIGTIDDDETTQDPRWENQLGI